MSKPLLWKAACDNLRSRTAFGFQLSAFCLTPLRMSVTIRDTGGWYVRSPAANTGN